MLVVPLEKDVITSHDGNSYRVISYTNYKDAGPAVYVREKGTKTPILIYFFDIDAINGTKVEYKRGSKIFRALGNINRTYHLPQPDDKVKILHNDVEPDPSRDRVEVSDLKLKSKALGISKGMFIKDETGNYHRLRQILDIDRSLGGEKFNRESFLTYYKDYIGA